jgi:hypothetical protein
VIIVADSSVLIGLSSIGQLGIIESRFPGGVSVPPAVWREVVEQGAGRPGSKEISAADWITVEQIEDFGFVRYLESELDDGEAEAIALARERNANVVLLDERDARETAKRLGLRVLGTVGLLMWGRREGMVQSLKSTLTDLQDEGNFRLSRSLFEFALRQVGEME